MLPPLDAGDGDPLHSGDAARSQMVRAVFVPLPRPCLCQLPLSSQDECLFVTAAVGLAALPERGSLGTNGTAVWQLSDVYVPVSSTRHSAQEAVGIAGAPRTRGPTLSLPLRLHLSLLTSGTHVVCVCPSSPLDKSSPCPRLRQQPLSDWLSYVEMEEI